MFFYPTFEGLHGFLFKLLLSVHFVDVVLSPLVCVQYMIKSNTGTDYGKIQKKIVKKQGKSHKITQKMVKSSKKSCYFIQYQ